MQAQIYQVMTPEEAETQRIILDTQDWQEGKARTADLTGYIKRNRELKPKVDGDIVTACSSKVTNAISQHKQINSDTCMLRMTGCKFNKYDQDTQPKGGEYRRHTDAPWMGPVRTDFTVVLGLTDPDTYEGGDHFVEDPLNGELWEFRLKQGECLLYETGYAHWVTPVTKGARISALAWLESQVQGERKRAFLATLRNMSQSFEELMLENQDDPKWRKWFVDIGVVHSGLFRMWGHRS